MENIRPRVLVIIPARGNSKGIPRKNLRSLNGKPLIWYTIQNTLKSKWKPSVYVSSDDDEIITIAKKCGARIINRSADLAQDHTTLDPVIYDGYIQAKTKENSEFDIIVTAQPTSPLLKTNSIDEAIQKLIDQPLTDTIISATEDTHLTWLGDGSSFSPNYEKRVNRQQLTPTYKETGGFLICRNTNIEPNSRIGKNVDLFLLEGPESIDIDTYEDWSLCNYYLTRKKLLFVVTGNNIIGTGHAYRTLNLANEILDHEVLFLFDNKSSLGREIVKRYHYPTFLQTSDNIIDDISSLNPDIVINDILDTSIEYMAALKKIVPICINFEDLGPGSFHSDVTINAMYHTPNTEKDTRHFGYAYCILRDEFLLSETIQIKQKIKSVLITFGGVDPNDFTNKVLQSIYDYCVQNGIQINVVLGLGYQKEIDSKFEQIHLYRKVKNMSEIMVQNDVAFSSAGRTTLELASLGIPSIILCQNERELTHLFPTDRNGFKNLGLGSNVSEQTILESLESLNESDVRLKSHHKMLSFELAKGKSRVLNLIYNKIKENNE